MKVGQTFLSACLDFVLPAWRPIKEATRLRKYLLSPRTMCDRTLSQVVYLSLTRFDNLDILPVNNAGGVCHDRENLQCR